MKPGSGTRRRCLKSGRHATFPHILIDIPSRN
jgi:hypothetical protein